MTIFDIILSEGTIIVLIILIIAAFAIFALDLVNNELRERNLENLLYRKFEVDEYLKVASEFSAKSRNKARITKYNIYKAIGLYYKDEKEKALEWLNIAAPEVEKSDDIHLKILYTSIIFKILFRLGYNENVEKIYQDKKFIITEMLKIGQYIGEAHYLQGCYNLIKGEYKIAYEEFIEARKNATSRLSRIMISYQLAKVCLELGKIEEAEQETETVLNSKHSAKNNLYIYDDLERIIKERRSQNNNISTVDKDLEEQHQKEALEKMNEEIEAAVNDESNIPTKKAMLDEKGNIIGVKEDNVDEDVKKLREEEAFKKQLETMTKDLHSEMLVQNNLNK